MNPWPSSALWPRAWGQGQLCAVWGPEQNASVGRPGRSSYDVTACGPSEDEPCGMCTEPARSPSRDGADVQERRPSAGSRSHTSPERPSPSAPCESMACVGTRDPRGPQEGPPCRTINSSMPSFAIHEARVLAQRGPLEQASMSSGWPSWVQKAGATESPPGPHPPPSHRTLGPLSSTAFLTRIPHSRTRPGCYSAGRQ